MRVRSYFSDEHLDRPHIRVMLRKLHKIDWIATQTEAEALILEANLVRKHKPAYNIDLKDDKHYPYIKVSLQEQFPRISITRRVEKDGASYFGPFTEAATMRKMVRQAKRVFKIRDCRRTLPLKKPVRECLNYAMGWCSGACAGKISAEEYRQNVDSFVSFLHGRGEALQKELQSLMLKASQNQEFEKAASYRDQLQLVSRRERMQRVDLKTMVNDADVFGLYDTGAGYSLAILHFREAILVARRHFVFKKALWELSEQDRASLVLSSYMQTPFEIPDQIYLPEGFLVQPHLLQEVLSNQRKKRVQISIPKKGMKHELVAMAEKNARLLMVQKSNQSGENLPQQGLEALARVLDLPRVPQTIEVYDIANLGDSFAVAGMVFFEQGIARKNKYRHFTIPEHMRQNDFAMMAHTITRRMNRVEQSGEMPSDLFLIDGGKGQLGAVLQALRPFKHKPMVVALAKKEERMFTAEKSSGVVLPQRHPARRIVEKMRNEVHRWANGYHRTVRDRQFKTSRLEQIEGIGSKTAVKLLRALKSYRAVLAADEQSLKQAGATSAQIRAIKKAFAESTANA